MARASLSAARASLTRARRFLLHVVGRPGSAGLVAESIRFSSSTYNRLHHAAVIRSAQARLVRRVAAPIAIAHCSSGVDFTAPTSTVVFLYTHAPVPPSLSPAVGFPTGGLRVTVPGANFAFDAVYRFSNIATELTVFVVEFISSSSIGCVSPAVATAAALRPSLSG